MPRVRVTSVYGQAVMHHHLTLMHCYSGCVSKNTMIQGENVFSRSTVSCLLNDSTDNHKFQTLIIINDVNASTILMTRMECVSN